MTQDRVNADFSKRVVLATNNLPWIASPQAGIERRLLDRVGGEVARATSLVRYAPGSAFPEHIHGMGEEFLVLDGVFSDEHGDFPAGSYVRNPPGTRHAPRTAPGCTIFVKLRQMQPTDQAALAVDTSVGRWASGLANGHEVTALHTDPVMGERVTLERLAAGACLSEDPCEGGEEVLVLEGKLSDEHGDYPEGSWIRNPDGFKRSLASRQGTKFWAKRGHLRVDVLKGWNDQA